MRKRNIWMTLWVTAGLVWAVDASYAAPLSGKSDAVEFNRVVWDKTPLHIVLPVGAQRQVHFDGWQDFKLDAPDLLARESVLSTTILNGVVYWTARKEFPEQLVLAKDDASKATVMLYVSAATAVKDTAPMLVMFKKSAAPTAKSSQENLAGKKNVSYRDIVRYAAQALYAPNRLREERDDIVEARVDNDASLAIVKRLTQDGKLREKIRARAMRGWMSEYRYVTAVELANQGALAVTLTPYDLRGGWMAVAFHPLRGERDIAVATITPGESRTVYLLSSRPFQEMVANYTEDDATTSATDGRVAHGGGEPVNAQAAVE